MLIAVTEVQKRIGLTIQGTYNRIKAKGVKIMWEPFGPGKRGFIRQSDLKKVLGPRQSWKVAGKINAAKNGAGHSKKARAKAR